MDHLHDAAYLDSPMGTSVRGAPETLATISADDVKAFAAANVTAARTVVAAAGAVDAKAFAAAAETAFGGLPAAATASAVDAAMVPAVFTGSDKRMRFDSLPQASVAIAFDGAAHDSPLMVPLMVMEAYLGGFDVSDAPIP
jgi:predicted Zn-dependent peptidase